MRAGKSTVVFGATLTELPAIVKSTSPPTAVTEIREPSSSRTAVEPACELAATTTKSNAGARRRSRGGTSARLFFMHAHV